MKRIPCFLKVYVTEKNPKGTFAFTQKAVTVLLQVFPESKVASRARPESRATLRGPALSTVSGTHGAGGGTCPADTGARPQAALRKAFAAAVSSFTGRSNCVVAIPGVVLSPKTHVGL